ncbi:MAG: type II secretion system minor pseudopilin GspK [Exilibacterium sp.]
MKSHVCLPSLPADQRGAALIIALLIVAAVSGLAIGFSSDFQLSSARAENRWHGAQAREFLYGGEDFGLFGLANDDDLKVDTYIEEVDPWSQGLPPTPLVEMGEDSWIAGTIEDAQSRFNINSLDEKNGAEGNRGGRNQRERNRGGSTELTPAQRRFIRLLRCFEDYPVEASTAKEITNAVIDWLDKDSNLSGFGGAEASEYQEFDPPYRPANQLMKSASELRMVKGMSPELYALVEPYIIALPNTNTNINVNTASPVILRTFNVKDDLNPLTELDAQTMVDERGDEGYKSLSEFQQGTIPQQFSGGQNVMETEGLSVNSNYFVIHVSAQIGRKRRNLNSLVERSGDKAEDIKVVQRSDNSF